MPIYSFVLYALLAVASVYAQPAPPGASAVSVGGNVAQPLTLTVDDLKRMPIRRLEDVRQVRTPGAPMTGGAVQLKTYSGVLLRDILEAAKPTEKGRHGLRQSIVIATATDGYVAVFSWAELFLSTIGEGALVIFERNNTPLAADEGPLALVSLHDTQPGPRHVKWLAKIEIRRVGEP